jgi:hypothetical protein
MKRILDFLNSPFLGICDPKREAWVMLIIALFVAGFLYFFRPFGLSDYPGDPWWIALLFGGVTYVAGFGYFLFTTYVLKIRQDLPSWKFWKWIIYIVFLILFVAIGNFLMINYLAGWDGLTISVFTRFVINTAAIGIFPVAVSGMFSVIRNERYYRKKASTLLVPNEPTHEHDSSKETLVIPSIYNERFEVKAEHVFFIEAEENYVGVYYKVDSEPARKELIRNTFASIDEFLPDDLFLKCHRSYIVNLARIHDVSGNAQGLTLSFKEISETVPVSRSHIEALKDRLLEL